MRYSIVLSALYILCGFSAIAEESVLVVKSVNKDDYYEKGILRILVDTREEISPGESLDNAEWILEYEGKRVKTKLLGLEPFYGGEKPKSSSVLIILPVNGNFAGAEEKDVARKRRKPLDIAMLGVQKMKNELGNKSDKFALACYYGVSSSTFLQESIDQQKAKLPSPDDILSPGKCPYEVGEETAKEPEPPRLQTVLQQITSDWLNQKANKSSDLQRFVVVAVTDGASGEPVDSTWWKAAADKECPPGNKRGCWVEGYVIGLTDGGVARNIELMSPERPKFFTDDRDKLEDVFKEAIPWVKGMGLYNVVLLLEDSITGSDVTFTLKLKTADKTLVSKPKVVCGELSRKKNWLRILLTIGIIVSGLVIVGLIVVLIIRWAANRPKEQVVTETEYKGPSRGRLIVREGPAAGTTFYLIDDITYIGRSSENQVCIPDPSVGKRHASIRIRDKTYELEDLQSVNGIFVNGQKVLKVNLMDGDSIRLGASEMQFRSS